MAAFVLVMDYMQISDHHREWRVLGRVTKRNHSERAAEQKQAAERHCEPTDAASRFCQLGHTRAMIRAGLPHTGARSRDVPRGQCIRFVIR
jgi:hypothetical protein